MTSRLLFVLWASMGAAWADPDVPDPAPSSASTDPADQLEAARRTYLLGDAVSARATLQALVARAQAQHDVPWPVEADAWIYLAEIQYLADDRDAAGASFRVVLEHDPDFRISPYDHPLDVVGAFELVRTAVADERKAAARVRVPMPWWGYSPFGAPQFRAGHPVRGAVYATLQVASAGASVGAWVEIQHQSRIVAQSSTSDPEAARQAQARAKLYRDAWSIPAATLFYVSWGASVIDAGVSWRKDRLASLGASVAPRSDGLEFSIAGRF